MKINITPPKHYSDFNIHKRTKKYMKGEYNKLRAWDVFEGKNKSYYLYLTPKNIQIEVIDNEETTINEIEKYLEFLFCGQYIGVSFEGIMDVRFDIKNVQCFYL